MTAPHIRDLDIPDWHEVPEGATIPARTRFVRTHPSGQWFVVDGLNDLHAADRPECNRYFTEEPIPDPHEEIEAEARRLWALAYLVLPWEEFSDAGDRTAFRRLAAAFLDRQKEN